jgi:hypothetical protein
MNGRDRSASSVSPTVAGQPSRSRTRTWMRGISITTLAVALLGIPLGQGASATETTRPSAQSGTMDDISALLPLFLSSPERKRLALELETSIRQGDLDEAERQLNGAIEMGTLAIVLVDRLRDPNFLPTLHALGIKGGEHQAASGRPRGDVAAASCPATAAAPGANVSELQEALEREQARGDAVAWELATLTDEFRSLQKTRDSDTSSTTSKVLELQDQLQKERGRGEAVSQELAKARDELTAIKGELGAVQSRQAHDQVHDAATEAELAQVKTALAQERERSMAADRDLTAAREELRALQTSRQSEAASTDSKVAELQATLQQERERSAAASRELATAREEIQAIRTSHQSDAASTTSKVAELQGALQQERGRSDAAARELAAAKNELGALQALRQREAAGAAELTGLKTAELTQFKEALARERARADAVSQELADAIDEVRAARTTHGGGSTPMMFRLDATGAPSPIQVRYAIELLQAAGHLPPTTSSVSVSYSKQTIPDDHASEPVRITSLGDAPIPLREERPSSITPPADQRAAVSATQDPNKLEGASAQAASDDRLVVRANTLMRTGDVSGARLLLERSMESGNARAAFLLAETFDPHVLSKLGALGIRSDAAKARELYARARALGITQADERMQALQ